MSDTHQCMNCGEGDERDEGASETERGIGECGRSSALGCHNPCNTHEGNSARCESLPSQISNFTLQFFGTVVKTEINGVVTWSLPCGLDVGLPNNPRGIDEGLACYFLRLFSHGIVGFTGPVGDPGTPGLNGNNAYTVTLQSFTQPTLGSPNIQVLTQFNPALLDSIYVFIPDSGWYQQTSNDGNGTLFLTPAARLA